MAALAARADKHGLMKDGGDGVSAIVEVVVAAVVLVVVVVEA